jgi:uncharacterized protein
MYLSIERAFLLFYVFSLLGWVIESVYRSLDRGRPVNPGLLCGPYLPLYGTGAIILMLLYSAIRELHPALRGIGYLLVLTLVEYAAGLLLLYVFNRRCWDYRDEPLNFQGLICPGFSLYWVTLAFIFEKTLYPLSLWLARSMDSLLVYRLDALVLGIMGMDFIYSTGLAGRAWAFADRLMPAGSLAAPERFLAAMAVHHEQANHRLASWMARPGVEYVAVRRTIRRRALRARSVIAAKFGLDSTYPGGVMIRLRAQRGVQKMIDTIKGMK